MRICNWGTISGHIVNKLKELCLCCIGIYHTFYDNLWINNRPDCLALRSLDNSCKSSADSNIDELARSVSLCDYYPNNNGRIWLILSSFFLFWFNLFGIFRHQLLFSYRNERIIYVRNSIKIILIFYLKTLFVIILS